MLRFRILISGILFIVACHLYAFEPVSFEQSFQTTIAYYLFWNPDVNELMKKKQYKYEIYQEGDFYVIHFPGIKKNKQTLGIGLYEACGKYFYINKTVWMDADVKKKYIKLKYTGVLKNIDEICNERVFTKATLNEEKEIIKGLKSITKVKKKRHYFVGPYSDNSAELYIYCYEDKIILEAVICPVVLGEPGCRDLSFFKQTSINEENTYFQSCVYDRFTNSEKMILNEKVYKCVNEGILYEIY